MKIVTVILSALIIRFCLQVTFAQCACHPRLTLKEHYQKADVVFVGKVLEVVKIQQDKINKNEVVIKFEVTQTWKRDLERFVIIKELYGSIEGFELNAEWLLYAFKGKDGSLQIFRGCCSRTKSFSVAKKRGDVTAFKNMGEKPKKIIE